jgi:hypothetical protein
VNPQQWLDDVQSPSEYNPPSFNSLNVQMETASMKEVTVPEDNIKFPLSIKLERTRPELTPSEPM